ncbi:MAG: transcription elongation factor GreA [Clostridiales bacterium]|jgi:transcription elongation factor GreA|nr:transcription elongation factor GreA [Clostridiales bacterium]
MEKIILTAEGKKELEQRLNVLKNELIPQVVQRIKVAREQGDLSENAEYTAARDEQAKLEGEKQDIENKLKFGEVIASGSKGDIVDVGSKLKYLDMEEKEEYTFTIVGTAEADLTKGKISNESPLGQALVGKKVGDVCVVNAPKGGSYKVKILEILG